MSNPCTRCGKQRVATKTSQEEVIIYGRKQYITYTEWECEDSDCQKKVVEALDAQRQKRETLEREKVDRANQKIAARAAA